MFAEELKRFIGLPVAIQVYGDLQITGRVTQVGDSFVRVVNATQSSGREYGWYERMRADEDEEDEEDSSKIPELLVTINNIQAIACLTAREMDDSDEDDSWLCPDDIERLLEGNSSVDDSTLSKLPEGLKPTSPESLDAKKPGPPMLTVEIGIGVVAMFHDQQVDLTSAIKRLRQQMLSELGFQIPNVRINDSMFLDRNSIQVLVDQCPVAQGKIYPDKLFALSMNTSAPPIEGTVYFDPVHQRDAYWIDPSQQDAAWRAGYHVIEPSDYFMVSLAKVCREWADKLLTLEELRRLLVEVDPESCQPFADSVPGSVPQPLLLKVCKLLLSEGIPITMLVRIAEALAMYSNHHHSCDQVELTELVRVELGHITTAANRDAEGNIHALELSDELIRRLMQHLKEPTNPVVRSEMRAIGDALMAHGAGQNSSTRSTCLCVPAELRVFVRQRIKAYLPQLRVLSYEEIPVASRIVSVGKIGCPPSPSA